MRGKFITLEGIEGSGKSTQIGLLRDCLQAAGHRVVTTREPGGTPVAERLREIVLNAGGDTISPVSELLVMFAARAIHLDTLIRPALERGEWVLCDRFTDATYAYQGAGRGAPEPAIRALHALVHGDLQPDLTLLFDLPVEVGLARARARRGSQAADRFEREGREFFERVRASFLDLAQREPGRVRVIDADQAPAEVARAAVSALAEAGILLS
jgi:dTMP kinase